MYKTNRFGRVDSTEVLKVVVYNYKKSRENTNQIMNTKTTPDKPVTMRNHWFDHVKKNAEKIVKGFAWVGKPQGRHEKSERELAGTEGEDQT